KRIQQAVLPGDNEFKNNFRDSFVLFKPKDIVSGDFYWFTKIKPTLSGRRADTSRTVEEGDKEYIIYATADCTGHGVPGGFMSMLGTSFLNEIINEGKVVDPSKALNQLRDKIISGLKQTGATGESKDGMDIVLTVYDLDSNTMNYSAANNGFYLIRNGELIEHNADKQPIGYYGDAMKPFTLNKIELQPGDCIYTFTDGYADQFGGPRGKKLKYKTMEQKLLEIHQLPMSEQHVIMDKLIMDWMGDIEQNDDICLIGVRI
ncbi:MAG TPA: SpoIIE family protein phosphatase, partial [Flavobacteriales bacterium]|nr:SpoIIE family protein phosphatase [Flavobacteriales bacterium]